MALSGLLSNWQVKPIAIYTLMMNYPKDISNVKLLKSTKSKSALAHSRQYHTITPITYLTFLFSTVYLKKEKN